jgi:hypothetical protein
MRTRHFVIVFLCALVFYTFSYRAIENRRTRNGPWQVSFTSVAGIPTLIINEPKLNIANLKIAFPSRTAAETNAMLTFDRAQPVPFDVPFGQCVFVDPTFLPGTVVLSLFHHEIQLLPRTLTIDKTEHPWQSDTTINVPP